MARQNGTDWDQLLQQSEDLAVRVRSSSSTPLDASHRLETRLPHPLFDIGRHNTRLPSQDAEGFPRVERDLVQVEQLSQKLRARAARADHSEEAFAATRLLAQEGLNNRKCVCQSRIKIDVYTVAVARILIQVQVLQKPSSGQRQDSVAREWCRPTVT